MLLSIAFVILDCLSVTSVIKHALPDGLNPFWKLAFVFKCFTDTIILDDFKTALDKLKNYKLGSLNPADTGMGTATDRPLGGIRKTTETVPWSESRDASGEEKPGKPETAEDVDLERQLQYWVRREGTPSTVTK
jgi:hypothetical protein